MSDVMAVVEDILGMPTKLAGIIENLPEAQYHARGELSSTGARRLLESPAKFKYDQTHPKSSDAFDLGTAVHSKVLGIGAGVEVIDFDSWRTNAAKAAKAAAREKGKVPILIGDIAEIDSMAEAVLAHPEARRILESTELREVSVFANDPATGVDIRARFDIYGDDECADLKTAVDASPNGFMRAVWNFRYDVQDEHYLKARELVTGDRPRFRFLAVEKSPPYLVGVYELNEQWQEIGDVWATAARKIFRACSDADLWPGYGSEVHALVPPMGLIYEHQERFETGEIAL